jgi:hypothetical protein
VFASSCSLLIRGNIAAVRQEIHLSGCPNFPRHLCPNFASHLCPSPSPPPGGSVSPPPGPGSFRVAIEHRIGRTKCFRIVAERLRNPRHTHHTKTSIIAGLVNIEAGFCLI